MADPITEQQLIDAATDAETLEQFVSGDENTDVTSRLGRSYATLAKMARMTQMAGGLVGFATKTELLAYTPASGSRQLARVYGDGTPANNGDYYWDGTAWVKSGYDPATLATTAKTEAIAAAATLATTALDARLPLQAPAGQAWAVVDAEGGAAIAVKDDGTFIAHTAEIANLTATSFASDSMSMSTQPHIGFAAVLAEDTGGNAAVAVKNDGTLAAESLDVKTVNGLPVAQPANRYGGAYPYQVGFINNTGESLAEGSTGTAITTVQEYDNICWPARTSTGGVFLPSTIANGQYAARGENPMFGTQSGWKQLIRDENGLDYRVNDFKLLACNNGYSGYKIAQISKGTAPYAAMLAQANALQAYGTTTGKIVGWLCNILTIGANDGNPASLTDAATFKSQLLALASDLDSDVRAVITSQTKSVVTIVNQVSSRAPQLAVAQLECSQESPLIIVSGPMYQYTYYDALHINPQSERLMGALCGLVAKRVITDRVKWEPLQPVSHLKIGASIYVRFNRSGLAIDTTTLPAQSRFGFDCVDSVGTAVGMATNPVIVGRDTLRFDFSSESVAASVARIRTGHQASTGRSDSFVGGSTNLRGAAPIMMFDATAIYEWCAIFSYATV